MNPEFPNHVYRLQKALYGLKQALLVWYDRFSEILLLKGYRRGGAGKTLFVKRSQSHVLLVQVYVDR